MRNQKNMRCSLNPLNQESKQNEQFNKDTTRMNDLIVFDDPLLASREASRSKLVMRARTKSPMMYDLVSTTGIVRANVQPPLVDS